MAHHSPRPTLCTLYQFLHCGDIIKQRKTTPVANLELRKIRKGRNVIIRGLGETDS
jgi:hypothetical protein